MERTTNQPQVQCCQQLSAYLRQLAADFRRERPGRGDALCQADAAVAPPVRVLSSCPNAGARVSYCQYLKIYVSGEPLILIKYPS